ncbi:hypothetical protein ACLOJK_007949 [Asimina triloba]
MVITKHRGRVADAGAKAAMEWEGGRAGAENETGAEGKRDKGTLLGSREGSEEGVVGVRAERESQRGRQESERENKEGDRKARGRDRREMGGREGK